MRDYSHFYTNRYEFQRFRTPMILPHGSRFHLPNGPYRSGSTDHPLIAHRNPHRGPTDTEGGPGRAEIVLFAPGEPIPLVS